MREVVGRIHEIVHICILRRLALFCLLSQSAEPQAGASGYELPGCALALCYIIVKKHRLFEKHVKACRAFY